MKRYKIGDLLEYQISAELKEGKLDCYCSMVVYMYLNGFIESETTIHLQRLYMQALCCEEIKVNRICKEMKERLVNDEIFVEKISNKNKDECIEFLNLYEIDDWIIGQAKTLILLLPSARLENKYLYYYMGKDSEQKLHKIYIPDINEQYCLFRFSNLVSD